MHQYLCEDSINEKDDQGDWHKSLSPAHCTVNTTADSLKPSSLRNRCTKLC